MYSNNSKSTKFMQGNKMTDIPQLHDLAAQFAVDLGSRRETLEVVNGFAIHVPLLESYAKHVMSLQESIIFGLRESEMIQICISKGKGQRARAEDRVRGMPFLIDYSRPLRVNPRTGTGNFYDAVQFISPELQEDTSRTGGAAKTFLCLNPRMEGIEVLAYLVAANAEELAPHIDRLKRIHQKLDRYADANPLFG